MTELDTQKSHLKKRIFEKNHPKVTPCRGHMRTLDMVVNLRGQQQAREEFSQGLGLSLISVFLVFTIFLPAAPPPRW
jgi:hypothetical protein